MARRPTQIGHAGAPLRLVPLDPDPAAEPVTTAGNESDEDDRTTVEQPPEDQPPPARATAGRDPQTSTANTSGRPIDEHWDDGTTMDEATMAGSPPEEGFTTTDSPEEMTVEEGRPALARLVVIAGNDTGREFVLSPGKLLSIGRAVENDIVLTDIAVSRRHLDLGFEDNFWVIKDRGSGNGTLINDRIEEGQCRLQHGDKIEIGHTVFRFDHAGTNAGVALGWGTQNDDEASTVAGRSPPRPTVKGPAPAAATTATAPARRKPGTQPPPPPGPRPGLPPPKPRTTMQGPAVGAVSARLALPANPSASVSAMDAASEPGILQVPPVIISSTGERLDRSMTATAHVEPLAYASGSMPPALYPRPGERMSRQKRIGIAAGIAVGVTLIGLIAMLTTDDSAPGATASKTPSPSAAAVESVASADRDEPQPEPEPVAVQEEPKVEPQPEPQPEPEPVVVKVEAPKVVPKKVVPPPVVAKKKTEPVITKKKNERVAKTEPKKIEKVEKKPVGAAAAKKKAASLYASKDFKGAAQTARDAAEGAESSDAAELKKLASSYEKVGDNLTAGNSSAAAKPTEALAAYRRAYNADKALGGTHATMLREKLGQVAPKAAAGFMAKGNYEAAKQAADTAVNFGAGSSPTIAGVQQSLERKAGEFYASGMKLMASKPEDAKALLRRVLKIVPLDSPWYTKAYKALNSRPQKKDDDE